MKKRPQKIVRLMEVRERTSIKFRDFLTNGLIPKVRKRKKLQTEYIMRA